ncbi:MAG: transposase, partial [Chloroflexi bacterium]|nr:transposase [Chloroflexota bacterium]
MAEVGLVSFACVSMQVATAVLPRYRSKKSNHLFTQPQLVTILCLMRYEDWTFRETEVRLAEHAELRRALGLQRVPDHTTLFYFLRRLSEETIARLLEETVQRLPLLSSRGTTVAVDATGLAPGAISTFFVKRARDHGTGLPWRFWLKWLVVVDVPRRAVLAQMAKQGPTNDSATLRPLVNAAHLQVPIGLVLADAEFDSERNHQHIRQVLKARSIIPTKRGKATWRIKGIRAQMRRAFPEPAMPSAPWWRVSSRRSSASSRPGLPAGPWQLNASRPCCWAWPTTSIASSRA